MSRATFIAQQIRRALQILSVLTVTDESQMMEIADLYPDYVVGHPYAVGDIFKYGTNADGETQLYQVLQVHTSAAEWVPASTPSLYKAIGITTDGINIWTQPLGASDAYQTGDRVDYNGEIWISTVDGNVWAPGVYGWEKESH